MKKNFCSILSSFVFLSVIFTNPISAETVSPSPVSPDTEVVQRDYAAEDELPIITYKSEEYVDSFNSLSSRSLQEEVPAPEVIHRDEESVQNELNYYARESITDEEVQQDLKDKSNLDASFAPSNTGIPYGGNLVTVRSGVVSSENVAPYIIIKIVSFVGEKPQSIEFENRVYRGNNRLGA